MTKGVGLRTEHIPGVEFRDDNQIDTFLDYLFRTDSAQEWTNGNTKHNLFVVMIKGAPKAYLFKNEKERKMLREKAAVIIETIKTRGLEDNVAILNDSLDYDAYHKDSGLPLMSGVTPRKIRKTITTGLITESTKDMDYVFFVVHTDQKDMHEHIHSVYLDNDKEEW